MSEKDTGITLSALKATYQTLLMLDKYDLDKEKIKLELAECNQKLELFWNKLMSKYHIPLFVDKTVMIDNEKGYLYVIEDV